MEKFSSDTCNDRKTANDKEHDAIWRRIGTMDNRMWVALATALCSAVGAVCTLLTVIIMIMMGKL
jgi:hypothetical protein